MTTTMVMPNASTTTATPSLPSNVRLPKDLVPEHYNVELTPDMYGDDPKRFTFSGKTDVEFKVEKATDRIIMHTNKLTYTNSTMKLTRLSATGALPTVTRYEFDLARQFLIIVLDGQLTKDAKYSVHLQFMGPLDNDLAGLYRSSYQEGNKTM